MTNDTDFIQSIIDGLKAVTGDQRRGPSGESISSRDSPTQRQ